MTITASEGTTGQSGLIIPENIPGDDLRPWQLESVAETLRTAGTGAVAQAEVAEASWAGLPGVLESPQGPTIYAALGTPTTAATAIAEKFDRVATALDEFAAALRPIKETFAEIKRDAVEFRATITWDERVWVSPHETKEYEHNGLAMVSTTPGYSTSYSTGSTQADVLSYLRGRGESTRVSGGQVQILAPWTESSEHIDQNNALMDRLADAYTRLQNAEADCANAINRQRDMCMVEIEHIEAWQLKQSGENTVVLPWGSRVEEDRNCGESFWWGVGSAGKEMLEGAGGLIGYNGVRGDWSWEQVGQSWLGAVQGIGSLLVITSPPLLLLGMAGVPVLRDGVAMGGGMLKGLVAWDTWSENPSEAAGRVLVNVGSMFIPGAGQVGAAVKALSAGSRIIDLAGDAARLTDAATTGVTKLDGLVVKLDGLVGDAVGTGLRVDDVVSVGVRTDLPDTDALQVGSRSGDTPPPSSFVDDGSARPVERAAEPPSTATHVPPHTGLDAPPPHIHPDAPPLGAVDWTDVHQRFSGHLDGSRLDEWAEAVSENYPNLTPADAKGIYDYTGPGYQEMNPYLRGQVIPDPLTAASLEARIAATTEAISKLPTQSGTFHRGVGFDDAFLAQFKKGQPWSDPTFMSSSVDLRVAENFALTQTLGGKTPGIIEVIGRTGVDVRPISAVQREAEVLFQRSTPFEVVTEPTLVNGIWRVTIREVGP